MKLDLLTNATVLEDAIRFVAEKSSSHLKENKAMIQHDETERREGTITNNVF
jgi:hypothetical protein